MSKFARKGRMRTEDAGVYLTPDESSMPATHPALWEYMSLASWEDGTPRETSTLSLFVGANGLQACINDRDEGLVAFVSGMSLAGLLDALEAGLRDDSLDWRKARSGGSQKKRK